MRRALVLLALCAGCAAHAPPTAPAATEKPPITVAVIGFGGDDAVASDAENGCVMAVLEAGYRAVDRRQVVAALPNEGDVEFASLGRTLGADLVIDGSIARGSVAPRATVRLWPRMISTQSTNVLATVRAVGPTRLTHALGHRICQELLAQLP